MNGSKNKGNAGQVVIDMGLVDKVSRQVIGNVAYVIQRGDVVYFGELTNKEVRVYYHNGASLEIFRELEQKPITEIECILHKFTPVKIYEIENRRWR